MKSQVLRSSVLLMAMFSQSQHVLRSAEPLKQDAALPVTITVASAAPPEVRNPFNSRIIVTNVNLPYRLAGDLKGVAKLTWKIAAGDAGEVDIPLSGQPDAEIETILNSVRIVPTTTPFLIAGLGDEKVLRVTMPKSKDVQITATLTGGDFLFQYDLTTDWNSLNGQTTFLARPLVRNQTIFPWNNIPIQLRDFPTKGAVTTTSLTTVPPNGIVILGDAARGNGLKESKAYGALPAELPAKDGKPVKSQIYLITSEKENLIAFPGRIDLVIGRGAEEWRNTLSPDQAVSLFGGNAIALFKDPKLTVTYVKELVEAKLEKDMLTLAVTPTYSIQNKHGSARYASNGESKLLQENEAISVVGSKKAEPPIALLPTENQFVIDQNGATFRKYANSIAQSAQRLKGEITDSSADAKCRIDQLDDLIKTTDIVTLIGTVYDARKALFDLTFPKEGPFLEPDETSFAVAVEHERVLTEQYNAAVASFLLEAKLILTSPCALQETAPPPAPAAGVGSAIPPPPAVVDPVVAPSPAVPTISGPGRDVLPPAAPGLDLLKSPDAAPPIDGPELRRNLEKPPDNR